MSHAVAIFAEANTGAGDDGSSAGSASTIKFEPSLRDGVRPNRRVPRNKHVDACSIADSDRAFAFTSQSYLRSELMIANTIASVRFAVEIDHLRADHQNPARHNSYSL